MTSLKSFTLFSSLPTELRLKIYHQISLINTAHILKLSYSSSLNRYLSNTPPPPTLSISHESRAQTLLTHTYLSLGPSPSPTLITQLQKPHCHTSASSPYQHNFYPSTKNLATKIPSEKKPLPIPIDFKGQTLYISSLYPLLSTLQFQHTFLFHLSTSSARHLIQNLAVDLRVWNDLCEHGFLGVLARMRGLKGVKLVVEFGRTFKGELDWLEAPEYRKDLHWLAKTATRDIERVREGIRGKDSKLRKGNSDWKGTVDLNAVVEVRCVILTIGGEEA